MASVKLGSKSDAFRRQGQAWFCTTGLPSDIIVEVDEMSFHLHKFPLLSRSGVMEQKIAELTEEGDEKHRIKLLDIPGGAKTFELVAKFCYGVKLELTASNVVCLRCAAEHLQMTEEYGEGNLIFQTENFLNQIVLKSWKDSLKALETCDGVLEHADALDITKRCIESLAKKSSRDPDLYGWPIMKHGRTMQSPGGSLLWNGINTGAIPQTTSSGWWYEDATTIGFNLYKRLIGAMDYLGVRQEVISESLVCYAKKYLPRLTRRHATVESSASSCFGTQLSEEEQKAFLEEIEKLLPLQKGLVPTKFLFGLLRTALILKASKLCVSNLEKRTGMQLEHATLEDLLMPTFSNSMETLYNVDCVKRILRHFLAMDEITGGDSPCSAEDGQLMRSPSPTPVTMVARLIDGYLAEVAPDVNLQFSKFLDLAVMIPEHARTLDDGLYRAIDIFLKSHPMLTESEKDQLCGLMNCQKLSLEAGTHAAQNARLPLRIIVQVLFFEQLQLRESIAGCFLMSDNLEGSRNLRSGFMAPGEGNWASTVRENQVLRVGMDNMRMRVSELEKECSDMREEIKKLGGSKSSGIRENAVKRWGGLGFMLKPQMCSAQEGSVSKRSSGRRKIEKSKNRKNGKQA